MRLLGALGFAVAFGAVTAAVVAPGSPLPRIEKDLMAAIARRRTDFLDRAIGPLSMLATQEPLTVQALVALVMIATTIGAAAALHFVVVAVGSGVLQAVSKRAVRRARPAGPFVIPWLRGSSYPSGDLLTATSIYSTIAIIAAPHFPDRAGCAAAFTILPVLLGLLASCRVYVGVHHPSDVLGGLLLGASWALFVAAAFA